MATIARQLHDIWITAVGDMTDIEALFNAIAPELPEEFYEEINGSKSDNFAYFEQVYNKYTYAPCDDMTAEDVARECNPSICKAY